MKSELPGLPDVSFVRQGQRLASYTTFGIGGPAEYLAKPQTLDQMQALLAWSAHHGLRLTYLGGGSNVLIDDSGIEGLTVITRRFKSMQRISRHQVYCESGCFLPHLSRYADEKRRGGWEFMAAIPGTVGASVRINAGLGSGGQMADWVVSVDTIDRKGTVLRLSKDDLKYGYRFSSLLRRSDLFVTGAVLNLGPKEPLEDIVARKKELLSRRKAKSPTNPRNCGSVFRRTEDNSPPGLLIDRAGLKGYRIGQCQVSLQHANWIVNLGGGTASEVKAIIDHVQKVVEATSGVKLRREVVYLPQDQEGMS